MRPRVLFVGGGKGSWQIRGVQIGTALGARMTTSPTDEDWAWAEIVVLVKRAIYTHGDAAKRCGKPIVWDVLDFWDQPAENQMPMGDLIARVWALAEKYNVSTLIGATQAMADAICGVYIPHHARPRLTPNPVREQVRVIAYEGTPKYLGSWKAAIERECWLRTWDFVVNPPSLATADIVVALRGEQWDGKVCREWKSGVKLVNAIAAGRPVITQESAAQREIAPCNAVVDTSEHLAKELDRLSDYGVRRFTSGAAAQVLPHYEITSIARRYRQLFASLREEAA